MVRVALIEWLWARPNSMARSRLISVVFCPPACPTSSRENIAAAVNIRKYLDNIKAEIKAHHYSARSRTGARSYRTLSFLVRVILLLKLRLKLDGIILIHNHEFHSAETPCPGRF